jgi:hypothetical protein
VPKRKSPKQKAKAAQTPDFGLPGADSSAEVVHKIGNRNLIQLAMDLFGTAPAFWGRYFKRPQDAGGTQYHPGREHAPLRRENIRVLPIARQTERVNGSQGAGAQDAEGNVEAIFAAFPMEYLRQLGSEFFVYLDIEGQPSNASLSVEYWVGWSAKLQAHSQQLSEGSVTLLPCVYCNFDPQTWRSLDYASHHGAPCSSAWVAHWVQNPPSCLPLRPWHDPFVTPHPAPPCPVHVWQYAAECHGGDGIDLDMANPANTPDDFISKLILPPE